MRELPRGGVFGVFYYDAASGHRRPDHDPRVGPAYLRRMAADGGEPDEIAVAVRQDTDGGSWYLAPHSHEWVYGWPEGLRSTAEPVEIGPPVLAAPTRAGRNARLAPDWWRQPSAPTR